MHHPLVSVVIPAFHAKRFLAEAIESLLSQTYENWEGIIVDDGSTDGTWQLAESLVKSDSRLRLICQANQGVAAARNTGIQQARGDMFAPLDADDCWHPKKLAAQVERLNQGGESMGLVYCGCRTMMEDGTSGRSWRRWNAEGEVYHALLFANFIGNASVPPIRMECLHKVGGYNSDLRARGGEGCEDWELALRIARHFNIGYVPAALTYYRTVEGSMSHCRSGMSRSYELAMKCVLRDDPGISPQLLAWSRANFYFYMLRKSRSKNDLWGMFIAVRRVLCADRSLPAIMTVISSLALGHAAVLASLLAGMAFRSPREQHRCLRRVRDALIQRRSPSVDDCGGREPWAGNSYWSRINKARGDSLMDRKSEEMTTNASSHIRPARPPAAAVKMLV